MTNIINLKHRFSYPQRWHTLGTVVLLSLIMIIMPGTLISTEKVGQGIERQPQQRARIYDGYITINYYLNNHRYSEAEALMDQFLETHPGDPFILTEKARLAHQLKNDSTGAIALLEKALKSYPNYYFSNSLLASILFFQYPDDKEKVDRAVKCLKVSVKDNEFYFESNYLLGVILHDRGEYAASNAGFERANRLERKLSSYYYMASNYNHLKDQEREIEVYKSILSFSPSNYKALSTLSKLYMDKKEYKTALAYLEKLHQSNPDDPKLTNEYLYALYAAGEDARFLETVNRLKNIADSPMLVYTKTLVFIRNQRYDEALTFLSSLKTKTFKTQLLVAEVYLRKQDYHLAYQWLDKINPTERNHFFYSLTLQTYSVLGLNRRITELFEKIRNDNEIIKNLNINDLYTILFAYSNLNGPDAVRQLATTFKNELKQDREILTDLIHRLTDFPRHAAKLGQLKNRFSPNFYMTLNFYKKQKRFKEVIALLKKMIAKEDGDNLGPYLELGDIYLKQKLFTETEKLLTTLIKRFPESSAIKNFYAYFLALQNKKLNKALKISAETLKLEKENPAYIDTYGYILFKMGRQSAAVPYLMKAYQKNPFEEEIMEHLADYYRSKKEYQKIVEIYQRAVDNGVDYKDRLLPRIDELKSKIIK